MRKRNYVSTQFGQRNIFSVFSLGPEWDSSDEEGATPVAVTKTSAGDKKAKRKAVDKKNKSSKTQPPQLQEEEENLEDNINSNTRENDKDLVLYIGHLPKEFEEQDLMSFVSQFGKVHNCRVSRKLETGNSKGYAFVRFGDPEVCQIVCDTLHGYFLGRQRLVCQVRPASRGMFYNTETVIQQRKQQRALKQKQRNRNLASAEKLKEITARLVSREQKKRKQLAEMGIEYDFPGYKCNQEALQVELEEDDSNTKKERKRSDSVGSEGSSSKKNKKRKESIDSVGSASKRARKDSVDSVSSASKKKSKRKESIDSVSSETKERKKSTRKNSVDSEGSAKKEKKRSNSDASNLSEEPSPPASNERMPHSAKKAKKNKKDKKRRQSAP